jgi:hypothetical protein
LGKTINGRRCESWAWDSGAGAGSFGVLGTGFSGKLSAVTAFFSIFGGIFFADAGFSAFFGAGVFVTAGFLADTGFFTAGFLTATFLAGALAPAETVFLGAGGLAVGFFTAFGAALAPVVFFNGAFFALFFAVTGFFATDLDFEAADRADSLLITPPMRNYGGQNNISNNYNIL